MSRNREKETEAFIEWLGKKSGNQTTNTAMNQQQQITAKENAISPVQKPAIPTYQPVVPKVGVQAIMGGAVPPAMPAAGAQLVGQNAWKQVQLATAGSVAGAVSATGAARPIVDAIQKPGDQAWQRWDATGAMDNMSQEELLRAREQANIDARAGKNPYDSLPMKPDTGKTVWWNERKGQGTGKTTANYVIGRTEKALERGDYRGAMAALDYGVNAQMSAEDRQRVQDYIAAQDFGAVKDGKAAQGFVWEIIDAAGQYKGEELENWLQRNLTGDMLKDIQRDYGVTFNGSTEEFVAALRKAMGRNGTESADYYRQRMAGLAEAYQVRNATTAFYQRSGEAFEAAKSDERYGKTATEYQRAQTAKWIADWLADRMQIETNGTPMALDGKQAQYALKKLRELGYDVPELTEGNYHNVIRQLQQQTGNRAMATRSQLEQGGLDVGTMEDYLRVQNENEFYSGLQKLPKEELGLWDKIAESIVSVPFAVTAQPVVSLANVLRTMGPQHDIGNANAYVPVSGMIDNASTAMRQDASSGMGAAGQFIYNALMSSVDSFAGAALLGNGYTITMGLSSMGDEIKDALDRGAAPKTALTYGITKGLVEMLTEKYSTEQIVDIIRSSEARTLVERMIDIGVNGLTEGSEEIASDILGGIADAYLLRSNSEHNRRVDELVQHGYSPEAAEAEVIAEDAAAMMESGAAGALSGIIGSGMAEGVNAARGSARGEAEAIYGMRDAEDESARQAYREIAEMAGVEYSNSRETAVKKIERWIRNLNQTENAWKRSERVAKEDAQRRAEEMIAEAETEVPGLAMDELTVDTVREDTETIIRAAANAQTSMEAASAVRMAQIEKNWVGNAITIGRVSEEEGHALAKRLDDMIQSEMQRIGSEEREQLKQEAEVMEFFRDEDDDVDDVDAEPGGDELLQNDYEETEEDDNGYEGTEGTGDNQQREADLDPGRQAGRMDESGRGEEERSAIRKRAERAAEIRDAIRAGEIVPKSGSEIGLSNATQDETIWVLPDEITDRYEDLRRIKQDAAENGYKLTLVAGDIRFRRNGSVFHAEAVIETDENGGKHIVLRADTRINDPVANYNHEMWHAMVAGNRQLQAEILDQMREKYTEGEIFRMVFDYGDAYNWVYGEFTDDMTEEESNALAERYLEEALADAYGEIRRGNTDNGMAREAVAENRERIRAERAAQAAAMKPQIQEMDRITQGGEHEAGVVTDENGEGVVAYNGSGQQMYSLRTWRESGRDILERYLKSQTKGKKASLTKEEAEQMMAQMDMLAEICERFKGENEIFGAWSEAEIVERDGKPVFSVVKANGDYKMNLDFSLVCKKRRTLDAVFNEMIRQGLMDEIGNVGQVTISHINDIIRNHKFETACALCFVDAKRYRQGMVADTFCALWNNLVRSMAPEGTTIDFFNYGGNQSLRPAENALDKMGNGAVSMEEIDRTMQVYGEKTVNYKVAKFLKEHPEQRKLLLRGDFMSTAGFDAVKADNPELMKLYNAKKGTGGPKAAESDVQYLSEIVSGRSWTAAKAYAVGGVRIQSFSDYVARLVFDYIQMVGDLAAKKMPAHAYTKETMFALQFGMTGIKINMSLVPDVVEDGVAPGLDKDGNYIWRDGQSFGSTDPDGGAMEGFELAKKIQNTPGYGKNCGTIAVGVSDEQILKMLDDPDIRMIIPYHKSSLNHLIASLNNIDKFTDYTKAQTTKVRETGNGLPKGTKDFNFNEAMRKNGGDPKAAADEYLQWCKENKYGTEFVPKFEQFSGHPNYYKLLEDFSCFDEAGNKAPQGGVEIRFPGKGDAFGSMEQLIRQGLDEDAVLQGKQDSEVPKIVAEIRNEMNNGTLEAMEAEASGVLDDAKEMEAAGESMDDIAAATGWRRNESGMWQQSFSASAEDQYKDTTETDKEYLEAVEAGDTETAQRMVDQAARNAGYKRRQWHQTNATFNVFTVGTDANSAGDKEMPFGIFTKRTKADIGLGEHQMELFVRANKTLTVTDRSQMKRVLPERYQDIIAELDEINEEYGDREEKLTDELFDAEDAYMERVEMTDEEMRSIVTQEWIVEGKTFDDPECQRIKAERDALMAEWNQKGTTLIRNARHYITGWLRQNGYDSMEMLMDQGTQGRSTDALIVLDAEQVKLAAPVTYDDEGNVIPLSKRFDSSQKDIRFSASAEDQYETDRAAYMDALMSDNLEQLMRQEQEARNLRKAEEQQRVEEARASRGRSAMRNRAKVLQGDAAVLDAQRQAERAAGGETGNAAELVEADRQARQESIARRAAEMERQNERNREAIGKVDRSGMTPEEAARSRKIENAQKRTIQQLKQDIVQLERDIEAQRKVAEVMRASNEGENPDAAILQRREESARAAEAKERALRETLSITEEALARKQRDKKEAKLERDLQQIEKQAKDWTKKHLESQIKKAEKRLVALEQAERAMREAGADVASTVEAKEKTAAELRVMREAMRDTTRDQRDKAKKEEEKRRTAEKKKTAAQQAKTDFINDVLNTFQIGIKWRGAAAEALGKMADQLASTGTVSEQERNLMLKALIRRGEQWLHASKEAHAAWDSYHGSRFYVPTEVRAEFGDQWDAFQTSAWKVGVELTDNETDQSVRDWEREFYRDGRRADSDREALEDMVDLVREGFGRKMTMAEIMGRNQQQYGIGVMEQVSQMRSALDRMLNVFAEKAQLEYRVRSEYEGIEEWANKQVQAEHDRTTKRLRIADQKLAQRDHWIAEHLNEELKKKQERAARQTLFDDVKRLEKLARKQDPKTQEAVRKLIGKLDTVARWVSPKGLENLQALAAMYHEQQAKEGSNWEPDPYIEARIARLNQVQIDSLPIEDVRTLVQDVMALTHAIQTRNKMLSDLKFEQREKMALEVKKEIWGTKGTTVRNRTEKFVKGVLMEELLRPKTFLNMISGYHDNGAMASMIRALEHGQTKQLDYAMKAEKIFDEFTRNAGNREWLKQASSDKAEWEEVLGVRMSPMMKIALYMNSLNFQNRYHIIHGGVKIPEEQAYRAGMKEEAEARGRIVRFTSAQLKSLKSKMSGQELAYARMLTQYFDGYSAREINETSMELYGFERATTTNYYPITVVNEFKNDPDKVAMQTVNNGSIEGNRHLQERKSKSATPIKLISANQTLLQHVDEMSKFCGMAIPLRDFSAILSFAFPDFGSSVTETIGQRWGEDGKAYVEKLIKDIQGDGADKNRFDKIMANIRGKMAGATLSFNPGVTLSQFASLPGAAATLGVMPLAQGLKLWERVDTKLIETYTPLLWYRSGGAEEELQQLSKKKGIMEKTGWWLGGNWISKMDKFTVGRIWKACEYKVMTELGMQPGDAATVASGNDVFYRNVAELFNRTVYDTQPNYTTLQRTQIGRTKSEAVKMLNMYKTVPYQYYNMMFEAGGRLRAAKGTKKWNEAVKFAARSFGGVLVANVTYVLMKQIVKGMLTGKWPDEEEGMTMEAFGLDLLDTYAGSVMGLSELVAAIEEFTGVKQAGYINSDSNLVIGLYSEIKDEIQKLADADDWKDVLLQGKNLARSMSKLLGVPAGNFEKYIVGSVRQVFPEAGAYYDNFFKEIEAKELKQKTGEEFRAGLEVLMDNRTDGVADETIDEIQRLWKAGYDTIPKAIPSSLKDENDDKIKLTWGTKKAYREIWSEAVTGTIDELIRTDLYQAADDETKAIMINNLYTYAEYGGKVLANPSYEPNSKEKWISDAEEAQENGIDLAEFIAWRVTNAGLDGKDENGESVTGLKDQRQRELLDKTNWSDDQKAAVYGGQVSESKAGKLDELYNAGLDYQQANAVANAGGGTKSVMAALEMQGLNDQQRYRAAMVYAGETESKKLEAGQEFGVKPSQYVEVLRNADADGNGKVSQQEAEDYISGMSISVQQKAYLWQMVTDGKDGTNNQFGQTFGAEFYNWMHRNDE